jgi:hypothetical protein
LRRVHRPVRVVQQRACQRDEVGVALAQDRLGLIGVHVIVITPASARIFWAYGTW